MEVNDVNMKTAISWLVKFRYLPGFPPTQESLEVCADSLCRLVHNKTQREIYADRFPHIQEADMKLADVNDLDWLRAKVADECDKFPVPPVLSRMYCQVWPAYDRRDE